MGKGRGREQRAGSHWQGAGYEEQGEGQSGQEVGPEGTRGGARVEVERGHGGHWTLLEWARVITGRGQSGRGAGPEDMWVTRSKERSQSGCGEGPEKWSRASER